MLDYKKVIRLCSYDENNHAFDRGKTMSVPRTAIYFVTSETAHTEWGGSSSEILTRNE